MVMMCGKAWDILDKTFYYDSENIINRILFIKIVLFMFRCSGLAVIYSVHKIMPLLQLLNEVFQFMHGKEKQMKSTSGVLSRR